MDAHELQFHLTRLPENVQQNVLLEMATIQIVGISFLSKNSKNLVKSLNMISYWREVRVAEAIGFHFGNLYWEFHEMRSGPDRELLKPKSIKLRQYFREVKEEYKWTNESFERKDWIEHFKTIFNIQNIESLRFIDVNFGFEHVLNTFGGFTKVCLAHYLNISRRFVEEQQQLHRVKELRVFTPVFPNNKVPPNILIQNFDVLCIFEEHGPLILLNNLLICGSKKLSITADGIAAKDINRFIKLWQKGSNPQLEEIRLSVKENSFNEKMVYKNIDYKWNEEIRYFKMNSPKQNFEISGGCDIIREDGTKATFYLCHSFNTRHFRMFVWHEHCVGSGAREDQ